MLTHSYIKNVVYPHDNTQRILYRNSLTFLYTFFVCCCCCCCPIICARPGIPHLRPHSGLIPHRGPTLRGPREMTSDRWWAAIRRRHCTAAESLRWCPAVPVLIQHTQDTTYYAPCRSTMLAKPWIRLSERPPREQAATTSLHQSPTWTF